MILALDLDSVLIMTALVVNVSGILFILETLLRRDEGAGRIWALAFLAAMLTTLCYVFWAQSPDAWWAVAIGNAAFVAGTGCMWLGCRKFNRRGLVWSSTLVAVAALAAGAAVFVAGPTGGDWAGAVWMFIPLLAFAGAGAIECMRGELVESRTAWVLGIVLGLQSLYYLSRTTAFLTSGPESTLFQEAFGTIATSLVTVTLTIVAVVVTSVLRASRAPMRGTLRPAEPGTSRDGILGEDDFARSLGELSDRAQVRSDIVGVIGVRIDDLEQISTAFGGEVARAVTETWRAGVRRHAPAEALVAEDGPNCLLVGVVVDSAADARRRASEIYRGLFDDLGMVGGDSGGIGGIIPDIGIGVALTDTTGHDVDALIETARETARQAAADLESSVLVSEAISLGSIRS